jgi:MoaA/NifB/PqqE/SkfB family radical SAM enzyme
VANKNSTLNLSEICSRKITLKSKPLQMNVDLTGRCNINPPCVFCNGRAGGYGYDHNEAPVDEHVSFISQCSRITDCSFGEPLTHPKFVQIIEKTLSRGQAFTFSTNGLLLKPDISDQLIEAGKDIGFSVSVNAATPETYYRITGKNLCAVLENVRYFIEKYSNTYGHGPALALSFIVMRMNRHEIPDFIRLVRRLKIPAVNFRHLFIDPEAKPRNDFGHEFDFNKEAITDSELSTIEKEAQKIAGELGVRLVFHWKSDSAMDQLAEPGVDIPCLFPWKFLFFQSHTQNVYTCCYTDSAVTTLAEGQTLDDAWNCPEIVEIREDFIRGRMPQYCLSHGRYCPLVISRV